MRQHDYNEKPDYKQENIENYKIEAYTPVQEVNREQLESRYNRKNNDDQNYNFGKRLRSQEKVNLADEDLQDLYNSKDYTYQRKKPKTAQEQIYENTQAARTTNQGRPNNFQMKNIVNKTEYVRKKLEDSPPKQTVIPEVSSKYEDSRIESSFRGRDEDSISNGNARSRSPFNTSRNFNIPLRQNEKIITRYSPAKGSYRTVDDPVTDYEAPRIVRNVVREQEYEYPAYVQRNDMYSSYQGPSSSPPRVVRRAVSPGRISEVPASLEHHEYPHEDASSNQRAASPRNYRLGSPARSPRVAKDPTTELNTLSRFYLNNLIFKTIENMVFEAVPEFVQEEASRNTVAKKGAAKSTGNKPTGNKQVNNKPVGKSPTFEFERKGSQSKKDAVKMHNQELMHAVASIDRDDGNVSDEDDTDEKSKVNQIISSKNKKEFKNKYVSKRAVDSMGIKFGPADAKDATKVLAYHEHSNLPMVNVKGNITRPRHEIGDVW